MKILDDPEFIDHNGEIYDLAVKEASDEPDRKRQNPIQGGSDYKKSFQY